MDFIIEAWSVIQTVTPLLLQLEKQRALKAQELLALQRLEQLAQIKPIVDCNIDFSQRYQETYRLLYGLDKHSITKGFNSMVYPAINPTLRLPHQIDFSPSFHIISKPISSNNTFGYTYEVLRRYNTNDVLSPGAEFRILANYDLCRTIASNQSLRHSYLLHYDSIVRLWIACAHTDFKIYFPARLELARLAHDTPIFGYADRTIADTTLQLLDCYYDPVTKNILLNPDINAATKIAAHGIKEFTENSQLQELAVKDGGQYIFQNYTHALEEAATAHEKFNTILQQELAYPNSTGGVDYWHKITSKFQPDYAMKHQEYWNDVNRSFYQMYQEAAEGKFDHAHDFIGNLKNGPLKRQAAHILKHLQHEAPYLQEIKPHTQYINKTEILEKRNAVITQIKTTPALCAETLNGLNQIQINLAYINSSNFHERIISRSSILKLSRYVTPFPNLDVKYQPILEQLCDAKTGQINVQDLNPAIETSVLEFINELHTNTTIASMQANEATLTLIAEIQQLQATVESVVNSSVSRQATSYQPLTTLVEKAASNTFNNQVNRLCQHFSKGEYEACTSYVETLQNHAHYQQLVTVKNQLFSTVFDEYLIPKKYSFDPAWAELQAHEKVKLIEEKGIKPITQMLEFRHETVQQLRKEFNIAQHLETEPSINTVLYSFVDSIQHKNSMASLLEVVAVQKNTNPVAYSAIFNEHGIAKCYAGLPQLKDFVRGNHAGIDYDRISNGINRALSIRVPTKKAHLKDQIIRYLKYANIVDSPLEAKLFSTLAEVQCKNLEGDVRYAAATYLPDLLKLFPLEEATLERARAAENSLSKFDPLLLDKSVLAAPMPGYIVTYLDDELEKLSRFTSASAVAAEKAAEKDKKNEEECQFCFCEAKDFFLYKADVERFNNHPKVKELGLKLTVDIAHHVMHGHVNRNTKKITGCHHLHGPCFCYTVTKIKTFNCGVSIAEVNCGNSKKPMTSLFPDLWDHSKIIDVILECLEKGDYKSNTFLLKNKYILELQTQYNFIIELSIILNTKNVDSYYPQIKSMN